MRINLRYLQAIGLTQAQHDRLGWDDPRLAPVAGGGGTAGDIIGGVKNEWDKATGGGGADPQAAADAANAEQAASARQAREWAIKDRAAFDTEIRPFQTTERARVFDPNFVQNEREVAAGRVSTDFAQAEAQQRQAALRRSGRAGLSAEQALGGGRGDIVRSTLGRTGMTNVGRTMAEEGARRQQYGLMGAGEADRAAGYAGTGMGMQGFSNLAQREQNQANTESERGIFNRAFRFFGAAKGGEILEPGADSEDMVPGTIEGKEPIRLNHGEYVIPAAVVRRLGTKFFDTLVDKHMGGGPETRKVPSQSQQQGPRRMAAGGYTQEYMRQATDLSLPEVPVAQPKGPGKYSAAIKAGVRAALLGSPEAGAGTGQGLSFGETAAAETSYADPSKLYAHGGEVRRMAFGGRASLRGAMLRRMPMPQRPGSGMQMRPMPAMAPGQGPAMAGQRGVGMRPMPAMAPGQGPAMAGQRGVGMPPKGMARLGAMPAGGVPAVAGQRGVGMPPMPAMAHGGPVRRMEGGGKVGKVMGEFQRGTLYSGSPHGPVVQNRKQAIAIGLNEARKAGERVAPRRMAAGGKSASGHHRMPNGHMMADSMMPRRYAGGGPLVEGSPADEGENPYKTMPPRDYLSQQTGSQEPQETPLGQIGGEVAQAALGAVDPSMLLSLRPSPGGTGEIVIRAGQPQKIGATGTGLMEHQAPGYGQSAYGPARASPGDAFAASQEAASGLPPGEPPAGPAGVVSRVNLEAPPPGGLPPTAGAGTPISGTEMPGVRRMGPPATPTAGAQEQPLAAGAGRGAESVTPAAKREFKKFDWNPWALLLGPRLFPHYLNAKKAEYEGQFGEAKYESDWLGVLNQQRDQGNESLMDIYQKAIGGDYSAANQVLRSPAMQQKFQEFGLPHEGTISPTPDGKGFQIIGRDGKPLWMTTNKAAQSAIDAFSKYSQNASDAALKREMGKLAPQLATRSLAGQWDDAKSPWVFNKQTGEFKVMPGAEQFFGRGFGGGTFNQQRPALDAMGKLIDALLPDQRTDVDTFTKKPNAGVQPWLGQARIVGTFLMQKGVDHQRAAVMAVDLAKLARKAGVKPEEFKTWVEKNYLGGTGLKIESGAEPQAAAPATPGDLVKAAGVGANTPARKPSAPASLAEVQKLKQDKTAASGKAETERRERNYQNAYARVIKSLSAQAPETGELPDRLIEETVNRLPPADQVMFGERLKKDARKWGGAPETPAPVQAVGSQ